MSSNRPKLLAAAAVLSIVLTFLVRSRFGESTYLCDGSACVGASGSRSLLTGVAFAGPFVAALGLMWSGVLEERGLVGPRARWKIPDFEQIAEGLAVIVAALITYWLLLNGPSHEAIDIGRLNTWANDLRNFRRPENTVTTDLVPSGSTWVIIGMVLSAPFMFSFGSMIGRELASRRERKALKAFHAAGEGAADQGPIGEIAAPNEIDLDLDDD